MLGLVLLLSSFIDKGFRAKRGMLHIKPNLLSLILKKRKNLTVILHCSRFLLGQIILKQA